MRRVSFFENPKASREFNARASTHEAARRMVPERSLELSVVHLLFHSAWFFNPDGDHISK